MGFRENLKDQLKYSGIYVKELAALSGIKKQTIDGYLNTHQNIPSAENAVKIARVLGVTVEYLINGEGDPKKKPQPGGARPLEAQQAAQIVTGLSEKNRKMALAIIKTIKKQDELEKSQGKS